MITVCDPHGWMKIHQIEKLPDLRSGFMWWRGGLREVRDIHQTNNGIQIELY